MMTKTVNELEKARTDALFELKEWQKLLIHFDLAPDSFAFIPLIVPDASWAEVCHKALADFLRKDGNKRLVTIKFKNPDELKNLASTVFELKPQRNAGAVWIYAPASFRLKDADEWRSAWREAVARLNQYRNPFREKFELPILLVGAEWIKEITRDMAPDLWSVMTILVTIKPPIITTGDTERIKSLSERFPGYEDNYGIDPYFALEEAEKLRGQKGKEETLARILNRSVRGLLAKGKYIEALEVSNELENVLKTLIKRQKSDELEKLYAAALSNKAVALDYLGRYDEAIELYKQALLIDEKTVGKEHPDYANHLSNLAVVYDSQGRYDEAIELYKQALLIDEKTIGKEHPDYALRLNNLAEVYRSQGRYDEAIKLYKQALLIGEKTIGKEHPNYAIDLSNLANVYELQKKYKKALDLYKEALKIDEKTLPENHPYTLQDRESVERCRRMLEEAGETE